MLKPKALMCIGQQEREEKNEYDYQKHYTQHHRPWRNVHDAHG